MKPNLVIEICPNEPRATMCTMRGDDIAGSQWESDIADCRASGDCQDACEYVLDDIGVKFEIIAQDESGKYVSRDATPAEKQATCEAIYFESETDFSDERWADIYLVWEAAANEESE